MNNLPFVVYRRRTNWEGDLESGGWQEEDSKGFSLAGLFDWWLLDGCSLMTRTPVFPMSLNHVEIKQTKRTYPSLIHLQIFSFPFSNETVLAGCRLQWWSVCGWPLVCLVEHTQSPGFDAWHCFMFVLIKKNQNGKAFHLGINIPPNHPITCTAKNKVKPSFDISLVWYQNI